MTLDGLQINFLLRPNSPLLRQRTQALLGSASAATTTSKDRQALPSSSASSAAAAAAAAAASAHKPRLSFYTVRPSDYPIPYDALEAHSVLFSAVEKSENRVLTVSGRRGL